MDFFIIKQRIGKLASLLNSAITSSDREEASRLLFRFFIWKASVAAYLCVTGKLN